MAVTGDAELTWPQVLEDCAAGKLEKTYRGGQVDPNYFTPARWDLMKVDRYLVGSVQTVRGCPKQCSFCSVWIQDGQVPRLRTNDGIIQEVQELYRAGFRLVMFSDDNFYPYSREDIANARNAEQRKGLEAGLEQRFDLLRRLEKEVPNDMFFCTQITMEVADDPEYLSAMKKAGVVGALIGIETVTEEGLKATNKTFNSTGDLLAEKLETVRTQGFPYIMGAFIFGIETDTRSSLDYTIQFARDCGLTLAQFIPLTPLPGTVDFHMMKRGRKALKLIKKDYDYWLDPQHPRILYPPPQPQREAASRKGGSGLAEVLQYLFDCDALEAARNVQGHAEVPDISCSLPWFINSLHKVRTFRRQRRQGDETQAGHPARPQRASANEAPRHGLPRPRLPPPLRLRATDQVGKWVCVRRTAPQCRPAPPARGPGNDFPANVQSALLDVACRHHAFQSSPFSW